MEIDLTKLSHKFGKSICFRNLSYTGKTGDIIIVKGKNGSGKSTLLRLISGFLFPDQGSISFRPENISLQNRHEWLGFCAPSISLYGELSGLENLELILQLKNTVHPNYKKWLGNSGLTEFDLGKPLKSYSSGMKQRMKILTSVLHQPQLLIWDEPMSNLDKPGKNWVRKILSDIQPDTLIFIASNDEEDIQLSPLCIDLDSFK